MKPGRFTRFDVITEGAEFPLEDRKKQLEDRLFLYEGRAKEVDSLLSALQFAPISRTGFTRDLHKRRRFLRKQYLFTYRDLCEINEALLDTGHETFAQREVYRAMNLKHGASSTGRGTKQPERWGSLHVKDHAHNSKPRVIEFHKRRRKLFKKLKGSEFDKLKEPLVAFTTAREAQDYLAKLIKDSGTDLVMINVEIESCVRVKDMVQLAELRKEERRIRELLKGLNLDPDCVQRASELL